MVHETLHYQPLSREKRTRERNWSSSCSFLKRIKHARRYLRLSSEDGKVLMGSLRLATNKRVAVLEETEKDLHYKLVQRPTATQCRGDQKYEMLEANGFERNTAMYC